MHLFLTGTGTDVGKTHLGCLILRAWAEAGLRPAAYKPVCCGDRMDAALLCEAAGAHQEIDAVNPHWLKSPAAPYAAGLIENAMPDPEALVAGFRSMATDHSHILVEGAGGWEVPLAPGKTMADFAEDLSLPVGVVVDNKLGALNHTLLTVAGIQARGIPLAGVFLNYVDEERDAASISNAAVLREFLPEDTPVTEILHGETELPWDAEWATG